MIGQYTDEEMKNMSGIISTVKGATNGHIIRHIGNTVNYYRQHSDSSWTNYNCRTVDRYR